MRQVKASSARITLILGALTAFAPMSIDMYLPSLPTLESHFGATTAAVQLTLSAFFIGLALGQLIHGPLADRHGRRPALFAGLLLYIAATAGCALAVNIEGLIVLRFLQAVGGCAGVVIARAAVRDLFDHRESARMLSVLLMVMGVAPILAPIAGGWILVNLGWQAIFWALFAFGAVCLIAAAAGLPETRPVESVRADVFSALSGYWALLCDPRFRGYAFSSGLTQSGMFAYLSGSPFVFIEVFGLSAGHYAWILGLNSLGFITFSQVNRRLLKRHRLDAVLKRAHAVNAAFGVLLLTMALTGIGGIVGILIPLFGYMASLGFTFPNATASAMAPFPERAGSASALVGAIQFGIASIAGMVVGILHNRTAVPMAAIICACGVFGLAVNRLATRRVAVAC
jgi:DHA1 family bicyclomycin/chloramphenicol resistance-like MFS transporter